MKIYYPQKQPLIVSAKKLFSKFQEICQENIRVRLQFLQNLGFMLILRKGAVFYPNVLGSNGLNIFVYMNIFKLQTSYVTIKAKFLKSHKIHYPTFNSYISDNGEIPHIFDICLFQVLLLFRKIGDKGETKK